MAIISNITGREILDSRGRPTVEARCELQSGVWATASVPSGASTGRAEALELRDGDPNRYGGLGCHTAAQHISGEIKSALANRLYETQLDLDQTLLELDGTPNKARLGANAILAASLAFARSSAAERGIQLYQYFADMLGRSPQALPRLTVNLFSGGKHAGNQVPIQDVLVVPVAATSIDESLAQVYAVYQAAVQLIALKYGMRALTADEGGLAPPHPSTEMMFQDAVDSIRAAGLVPGREIALAVDVASSHFYREGNYSFEGEELDSLAIIELLCAWVERYPIISVEDGLAEEDWQHWSLLRERLSGKALVLGDDLLCTNPLRIQKAIETHAADALLLKVNQIGTLSEAAEAFRLAFAASWNITISARSGETEDNWLADLAVGWGGNQIKIGSITHSERLAKYNRLLAIESETGLGLQDWPRI